MTRVTHAITLLTLAVTAHMVVVPQFSAAAHAEPHAQSNESEVPRWAYWALEQLASAGLLDDRDPHGYIGGPTLLSRYQFAVLTARALQKLPFDYCDGYNMPSRPNVVGPGVEDLRLSSGISSLERQVRQITDVRIGGRPAVYNPEVRTALEALRREFRGDIARLGCARGAP